MPFTGQLGTTNSKFGNIVLGVASGLGNEPFGFDSHVLTSSAVRVPYTRKVVESSALDIGNYVLTAITGTAVVPAILSARFFDETRRAVVLELERALTYSADYSLQVDNVASDEGEVMFGLVRNFAANVQDPPKVLGAFLSDHERVDLVFDRSVGPTSVASTFEIRDASLPGPGVSMVQVPWAAEGIPEDTIRLELPGGTPTADAFEIDFFDVVDSSLNEESGTVPLTLALGSSPPYSLADLGQAQIVDAAVVGGDFEYFRFGIVRVWFSEPVALSQGSPEPQVSAWESGPHPVVDTLNEVTAPNAFSLPTLMTLLADFKAKFNSHIQDTRFHLKADAPNVILTADPVDEATAVDFINEAQAKLKSHFINTAAVVHTYADTSLDFSPINAVIGNLSLSYSLANNRLKAYFNSHVEEERSLFFVVVASGIFNKVRVRYTASSGYPVRSAYTWFADLHLRMASPVSTVRIEANILSVEGSTSVSSGDFTGNVVARSLAGSASVQSHLVVPERAVEIRTSGEMEVATQSSIRVFRSDGSEVVTGSLTVAASLQSLMTNINMLILAFNLHRFAASAGHQLTDSDNIISAGAAAQVATVENASVAANNLKANLNWHLTNNEDAYHIHVDPRRVTAPDADDLESLTRLVRDVRDTYLDHNQNGPHSRPGYVIYNASLYDVVRVEAGAMVDGETYSVEGSVRHSYLFLPAPGELGISYSFQTTGTIRYVGERRFSELELDEEFTAVATRPSLASTLSKSGLFLRDDGVRLESDSAEVYFSKPMRRVPLDSSNLVLAGGSTLQKETDWVDEFRASVRVVNMTAVSHTMTAVGLTDEAGNPVY